MHEEGKAILAPKGAPLSSFAIFLSYLCIVSTDSVLALARIPPGPFLDLIFINVSLASSRGEGREGGRFLMI